MKEGPQPGGLVEHQRQGHQGGPGGLVEHQRQGHQGGPGGLAELKHHNGGTKAHRKGTDNMIFNEYLNEK